MTMDGGARGAYASLQAVLASARHTVKESLVLAEAMGRVDNSYMQEKALDRAIAFMKVSAKLGQALARLEGRHISVSLRPADGEAAESLLTDRPPVALASPFDDQDEARISKMVGRYRAAEAANRKDME